MMRWINVARAALCAAAFVAAGAVPSVAQVYFQYPDAAIVPDNAAATGGAMGFGDNLVRGVGYGRFNVAPRSDLGIELVADISNSDGRLGAGVDYRHSILSHADEPVDLSVGGGLGFQTGGGLTNFDVPLGGVISRPLKSDGGKVIVPYGGLYLLIHHYSIDGGPDNTDLDLELRVGASFQVATAGDLFVAIHVGEDVLFFAGFNASL